MSAYDGIVSTLNTHAIDKKEIYRCAFKDIDNSRKNTNSLAYKKVLKYVEIGHNNYTELLRKQEESITVNQIIKNAGNIGFSDYLVIGMSHVKCK